MHEMICIYGGTGRLLRFARNDEGRKCRGRLPRFARKDGGKGLRWTRCEGRGGGAASHGALVLVAFWLKWAIKGYIDITRLGRGELSHYTTKACHHIGSYFFIKLFR